MGVVISLESTDRSYWYSGASYDLPLETGKSYRFDAWVQAEGDRSVGDMRLLIGDDQGYRWVSLSRQAVNDTSWTKLSSMYQLDVPWQSALGQASLLWATIRTGRYV